MNLTPNTILAFTNQGSVLHQVTATQGIEPGRDSISAHVGDLCEIEDPVHRRDYAVDFLTACIRQIINEHNGCVLPSCRTCAALQAAKSLTCAYDEVHHTRLWTEGDPW